MLKVFTDQKKMNKSAATLGRTDKQRSRPKKDAKQLTEEGYNQEAQKKYLFSYDHNQKFTAAEKKQFTSNQTAGALARRDKKRAVLKSEEELIKLGYTKENIQKYMESYFGKKNIKCPELSPVVSESENKILIPQSETEKIEKDPQLNFYARCLGERDRSLNNPAKSTAELNELGYANEEARFYYFLAYNVSQFGEKKVNAGENNKNSTFSVRDSAITTVNNFSPASSPGFFHINKPKEVELPTKPVVLIEELKSYFSVSDNKRSAESNSSAAEDISEGEETEDESEEETNVEPQQKRSKTF